MDRLMDLLKREASELYRSVGDLAVTPSVKPMEIREFLERNYDFEDPVSAEELFAESMPRGVVPPYSRAA